MTHFRQAELTSSGSAQPVLLGVQATGVVSARLLDMTIEQHYRNPTKQNIEVAYTFPLPYSAVLMDVEVELNGKPLRGLVAARSAARADYEAAVSEGNSSVLLEQNDDGSYTLELGNLLAGETCCIRVRYTQALSAEHGQVRLMLPTTIAPRYGDAIAQGQFQPHQVPQASMFVEYPFSISLSLQGDLALASVGSPSHKTSCTRAGDRLLVKLAQSGALDRDFILIISGLENTSCALLSPDAVDEGQHALLAFLTPRLVAVGSTAARVKILVDCSGSMAGDSMDAARRALRSIVTSLSQDDRFSLSRFGDTVEHRSSGLWFGTQPARTSALQWVDALEANLGGTHMAEALASTLALADSDSSDILLITDGEVYDIDSVIALARKSTQRVFVVGIGASPAEAHLRRLASATGGHCDFVAPGEDVEPAVLRMSRRMRGAHASHVRAEWPAGLSVRWAQSPPSHAYADDTLTLCALVQAPTSSATPGSVKLWGRAQGSVQEQLLAEAPLIVAVSDANAHARLAAYAQCQERWRVDDHASSKTKSKVTQDLAVAYRLVTRETSFILVHERAPDEQAQEMPDLHKVPQMLAAGWGASGTISPSSKRAMPATFDILGGYAAPHFLRRQGSELEMDLSISHSMPTSSLNFSVDDPRIIDPSPVGLSRWIASTPAELWPTTYAELRTMGLEASLCDWLELNVGKGKAERLVIAAFLAVVQELALSFARLDPLVKPLTLRTVTPDDGTAPEREEIAVKLRVALAGVSASAWPTFLEIDEYFFSENSG